MAARSESATIADSHLRGTTGCDLWTTSKRERTVCRPLVASPEARSNYCRKTGAMWSRRVARRAADTGTRLDSNNYTPWEAVKLLRIMPTFYCIQMCAQQRPGNNEDTCPPIHPVQVLRCQKWRDAVKWIHAWKTLVAAGLGSFIARQHGACNAESTQARKWFSTVEAGKLALKRSISLKLNVAACHCHCKRRHFTFYINAFSHIFA